MQSHRYEPSSEERPTIGRAAAAALAGAVLTLAALMFDASPLFVPGVAFGALGLLTPAWIWVSSRGATVKRRLHADRVVEDEPLEATIEVRRGLLGLPGGEVLDPLAGMPVSLSGPLSLIRGERRASVRVVARFPRRGRKHVEPPRLVVHDALELARFITAGTSPAQELLVLPRTEPVRWANRDLAGDGDPAIGRIAADPVAAVEIDGLRPYRPGAPASRIHWPALARGAGLLERRLRADADSRPLVVLDARCASSIEHLDAAVRAAASLVLELARGGGCGVLLPGDRRPIEIGPELGGWPAAHARLALVESEPRTRPPHLATGARLGRIFYVAAETLARTPDALRRGSGPGGVIVLPRAAARRMPGRPSLEVAGCVGYVIGTGRRRRIPERAA